jgi:hypothetical protein
LNCNLRVWQRPDTPRGAAILFPATVAAGCLQARAPTAWRTDAIATTTTTTTSAPQSTKHFTKTSHPNLLGNLPTTGLQCHLIYLPIYLYCYPIYLPIYLYRCPIYLPIYLYRCPIYLPIYLYCCPIYLPIYLHCCPIYLPILLGNLVINLPMLMDNLPTSHVNG